MVSLLTFGAVVAAFSNENLTFMQGAIFALFLMSPAWLVVLWTARTQPVRKEDDSCSQ